MHHYKYLIVGGGMTAASAVKGIRHVDKEGSIGLFGSDPHKPYDRPPLTKGLWKGEAEDAIWRDMDSLGAELHLGRTIRTLNVQTKSVIDDSGASYSFDKLLLATGVSPRLIGFGGDSVIHYRTYSDYRKVRELTKDGHRFLTIGGGFIGSELAASLCMNGKKVTMVFPGMGIGGNLFPPDLSEFLNQFYREKGVEVLTGSTVFRCERDGQGMVVGIRDDSTGAERELTVDGVIAGVGTQPNVELAQQAGLEVENGIRVNAHLQTSHMDVYAAGDVASFFDATLQKWRRVEHEDNANTMGDFAGRSMAGEEVEYTHLPFFYSDLFELGYEAVGDVDARHETFSDWKEPFRQGVVYYLAGGRVLGVLLWNVWDKVDAARQLIAEAGPLDARVLKGRISD